MQRAVHLDRRVWEAMNFFEREFSIIEQAKDEPTAFRAEITSQIMFRCHSPETKPQSAEKLSSKTVLPAKPILRVLAHTRDSAKTRSLPTREEIPR